MRTGPSPERWNEKESHAVWWQFWPPTWSATRGSWAQDEAGTLVRLQALRREFLDPTITAYRGRIVKLMGDGALVEFSSVVDAVQCAVELQRGTAERNADLPRERRIEFRIGINLGDVIIDGDDIYGDGVNIAARLEALAEPGAICISRTVFNHIRGKVKLEFR